MPSPLDLGPGRPTVYDVAARAGVSHSTVSRAVNGKGGMTDETRRRVLEAVGAMGYQPSAVARALAGAAPARLGLIRGSGESTLTDRLMHGLVVAARTAGHSISTVAVGSGAELGWRDAAGFLREIGVGAICMAPVDDEQAAGIATLLLDTPSIALAATTVGTVPTVGPDLRAAARLAVDHLCALGHRRIASIPEPAHPYAERLVRRAIDARLDPAGRILGTSEPAPSGDPSGGGVVPAMIFGCTALVGVSPSNALAAVHALASAGIRVPEDVSVVVLDDHPDTAHYAPPLTAVDLHAGELGALAMQRLLDELEPEVAGALRTIAPTLVVRGSTAPPRAGS